MKITIQGKNINTASDLSTSNGTLKYGDMIVYSGNYNGLVFGWFIGLSLTGKTTYVLSANGSVVSPFYTPIKFNWTSGINDLRVENIEESFALIESIDHD